MQSILPEDLEQDCIYRMSPGDTGYTLFWAIQADHTRSLWIRGDYPVQDEPTGDESGGMFGTQRWVRIERTREGVIVYRDTLSSDAKFTLGHGPMEAWYPLPVELR